MHSPLFGRARERADDIVGLDAFDLNERPAERANRLEQRLDLRAQFVGHRRTIRLVLRIQLVAEGFAPGVEHAGDVFGPVVGEQPS